ncbi:MULTISPECIES: hypothetical protein [Kitasatospora]|uniref:Uncharacterized protein n=1 Tax=Kitasatospora arboriphila TaxID=258052 RepID=A0ABP4E2Q9_9ACTN
MENLKCTQCSAVGLEPGFVEDTGQSSYGYARWIPGVLERGIFGVAKRMGKPRWQVDAFRCPACGHLELYAVKPV